MCLRFSLIKHVLVFVTLQPLSSYSWNRHTDTQPQTFIPTNLISHACCYSAKIKSAKAFLNPSAKVIPSQYTIR